MNNKKNIYIEVGANLGTNTINFIHDDSIVYCFEPTIELYYQLCNKFKRYDNVVILPFAIDIENSFKKFNVAGTYDWGCSSLHNFSSNIHNEWKNRPDFMFTDAYIVPTITLYDFVSLYNISHIDYLWIDAQGNDFNVLKSLKNKISIVQEGRCEASYKIQLYDNVNNRYDDIMKYLNECNFTCELIPDQSGISAECDIVFKRDKLS